MKIIINGQEFEVSKEFIDALQNALANQAKPEFVYPMWFENADKNYIVRFDSLNEGEVVKTDGKSHDFGYKSKAWVPHTDTNAWTQVDEPKQKYVLKGGNWYVTSDGHANFADSSDAERNFGIERQTKEQAIEASKQMRRFNRMLAWVAEHDDGWRADWSDKRQAKYYVYFNFFDKTWQVSEDFSCESIAVYMSYENAIELARQLNKCEFNLDGGAE